MGYTNYSKIYSKKEWHELNCPQKNGLSKVHAPPLSKIELVMLTALVFSFSFFLSKLLFSLQTYAPKMFTHNNKGISAQIRGARAPIAALISQTNVYQGSFHHNLNLSTFWLTPLRAGRYIQEDYQSFHK
jgi:hypothetical protein